MGNCIIFCAGGFDGLLEKPTKNDILIAADGGYKHTQTLGLTPDVILGDFDSLGYVPEGANTFPVEKDDTDAMLAVRRGLQDGFRKFLLYGSLDGSRLDHTVANFQTLQYLADRDAVGYLIGKTHIVTLVKDSALHFLPGAAGYISVFCMGQDAKNVSLSGLKYPLKNGTLTAGFPLGVSNQFTGENCSISVENGSLLVIFERKNYPFCEEML